MLKKLSRIAPWQAGKLFAVVYFVFSLIFVLPLELIALLAPTQAQVGPGPHFSPMLIILFPFLYAIAALIFVPLGCWIYNISAKMVGGLEITVADSADA